MVTSQLPKDARVGNDRPHSEPASQGILDTTPLSENAAELLRRAPLPDPRVSLLVFHAGGATLVSLEPGASVVIGREPPADVVIGDKSLSRRHARFSWIDA